MRRLEFLLTSVRRSTDNVQTSAITDAEMVEWFNDGQKLIQNLIFKSNPKADIFKEVETYDAVASQEYDLPADIYAVNAISMVEVNSGNNIAINGGFWPIDRIDEINRPTIFGYIVRDNKVILTGFLDNNSNVTQVRITYFKALPRVDKRWGTIQTVNSGVSLVLSSGYDDLASTVDDYVTVVDSLGASVREGIRISTFTAGTWATSDALTSVTAGQFVCMGKRATNVCELPDECEPYLLDYVRKRLYGRNVYSDGDKQELFTSEQKEELIRLFQNNTKEILVPPITDMDFMEW